jgi:hypothetical protein
LSACSFNNPKAGRNAAGFFVRTTFDLGLRLRVEAASFALRTPAHSTRERELRRRYRRNFRERFCDLLFGGVQIMGALRVDPKVRPVAKQLAETIRRLPFPEDVEQGLTRSSEQAGNRHSLGFTHSLFGSSRIHKTKPGGTADITEHRASHLVVGAGNENNVRRCSMTSRFMMSVAAAALIAGTGFANAQGTGMGREAPSAQQSAPPSERAAPSASPAARDAAEPTKPAPGAKATHSEQAPAAAKNQRAQDDMKAAPKGEKSAQDNDMKGEKSKSMSSENAKGAKDLKAEGREDRSGMKAEGREDRTGTKAEGREGRDGNMKAEGREDRKGNMNAETKGAEGRSQTVGQAGAGAKLSTEQRTRISTVIKEQNIRPATNVNFAISVGTRVPREVSFHPLPVEIVNIYPDWRGYEMFLVNDQIVVVNPRTLEIVAVLDV